VYTRVLADMRKLNQSQNWMEF